MSSPDSVICIPARWGSTRFPGKPLTVIAGRTLLARVIALGRACVARNPDCDLVVATDDDRIAKEAERLACRWIWTDPAISSGSARTLAAVRSLPHPPRLIVNLQGDAPFVGTEAVDGILAALRRGASVVTPVVRLGWDALDLLRAHKRLAPFSGTTCIRDADGRARWFSKQIIPALRNEPSLRQSSLLSPVFRHVGVYGYRLEALERFEQAAPSAVEELEGLEQLRFFDLDIPIHTVEVAASRFVMSGIDTIDDARVAAELIRLYGEPIA